MKNHLDNPDHYGRMIRLLVEYNPLFRRRAKEDDTFASEEAAEVIDLCIASALVRGDCATGCCMALKTSSGKIRLFLEPLVP